MNPNAGFMNSLTNCMTCYRDAFARIDIKTHSSWNAKEPSRLDAYSAAVALHEGFLGMGGKRRDGRSLCNTRRPLGSMNHDSQAPWIHVTEIISQNVVSCFFRHPRHLSASPVTHLCIYVVIVFMIFAVFAEHNKYWFRSCAIKPLISYIAWSVARLHSRYVNLWNSYIKNIFEQQAFFSR